LFVLNYVRRTVCKKQTKLDSRSLNWNLAEKQCRIWLSRTNVWNNWPRIPLKNSSSSSKLTRHNLVMIIIELFVVVVFILEL
jgi:hypothetical protein